MLSTRGYIGMWSVVSIAHPLLAFVAPIVCYIGWAYLAVGFLIYISIVRNVFNAQNISIVGLKLKRTFYLQLLNYAIFLHVKVRHIKCLEEISSHFKHGGYFKDGVDFWNFERNFNSITFIEFSDCHYERQFHCLVILKKLCAFISKSKSFITF